MQVPPNIRVWNMVLPINLQRASVSVSSGTNAKNNFIKNVVKAVDYNGKGNERLPPVLQSNAEVMWQATF